MGSVSGVEQFGGWGEARVASRGTEATILHADLDAFYASVEQRDDPRLRGRPVIVGGGVVLAASYEAKAYGVRTAMGGAGRAALCPDAVVVPPRIRAYTEASRAVFEIFRRHHAAGRGLSIDEAFLDVGGLRRIVGTPVRDRGAACAREVARAGRPADHRRRRPHEVPGQGGQRGGQARRAAGGAAGRASSTFLHPLPVERLWGVGPDHGREAARAAASAPSARSPRSSEAALVAHARAGRRPPPARARAQPRPPAGARSAGGGARSARSARSGRGRGTRARSTPRSIGLVDRVTRRMRGAGRVCRTVMLRLRFGDYTRATRSHTLAEASADTDG